MQPETLIKEFQQGLLKWYNFKPDSVFLYIGEPNDPCAAPLLSPLMYTSSKHTAGKFICVTAEQTENLQWRKKNIGRFDYIIAVEILEKLEFPMKHLTNWKSLLKPTGTLLLGMNNRFGFRYFCGDRDPYTGRNFDGIEGYRHAYSKKEDLFQGRCYSQAELRKMLQTIGYKHFQFYSVLTDLRNPSHLYAEDYRPNEDLSNRIFPTYNYPDTVFLEEECLYNDLIENEMFHKTANAYLIECSLTGDLSDVSHVTSSMDRGPEQALLTIIYKSGIVEKRAVHAKGVERLKNLITHGMNLSAHGISVVDAALDQNNSYIMPYIDAEVGQLYLKRLLHEDVDLFLHKMDEFRDLILHSSEIIKPDSGDGDGAILQKGYIDMIPLNSFYINGTFVFFDQEFCKENYPANVLIWRMVSSFYAGDLEVQKLLPMEYLLKRYDLYRKMKTWQKIEQNFLTDLLQGKILQKYHEKCRRNYTVLNSNRQRLNYSSEEYQKLFVDIFQHADTRKLILFGSGLLTKRFLALYHQDYPVYAIVDNNRDRWGQELEGIPIRTPEILKELQAGEYKVLICIKDYLSVMKQLNNMGIREYSIFDSQKDYPRKRKPTQNSSGNISQKKKYHTGYIAGVFDLFHVGHLNMFKRAKEQCDYLIVGVVTDEGVRKFKEVEPFVPYEERTEMLRSCRYVDEVVEIPLNYGSTSDAWRLHHFDCQFSGSDYVDNPDWLAEKEFLEKHGAEMVFFPYTQSTSSSKIKELIEKKLM